METSTHRLAGLAAGLAVAAQVRPEPAAAVALLVASTATAGGVLSPDVDQYRAWHLIDHLLPDEWLGHGGPMRHRGITHFWGLPAAAAAGLWLSRTAMPALVWWLAAGIVLGWAAHVAGDAVVGARSEFRRAGVPVAPWWWHVGLGARCGGLVEDTLRWLILPAVIVWQAAVLAGWAS